MRVAVFTESYHQLNGVGRTYRNMVEYANRTGKDLDIFITGDGSVEKEGRATIYSVPVEVPIEYYPGLVFDAWTLPRHMVNSLPPMIQSCFERKEYDLVMLATQGSMGLYAITASKRYSVPLVGSYHTQVPQYAEIRLKTLLKNPKGPMSLIPEVARELTYFLESYYYRKPIFNMAPTNIVCSMINQRFKRPTRVFRRGIDIERFHPAKARKKDGRTVLYVSRLAVEKNVDMLRGFSDSVPEGRLIIVGDGPERKKLERDIPEAEFKGFLTGEPLAEEYASADLFIFPSVTETYGNVVQEAMASGLPVILDSRGASSELVRHGADGFHYNTQQEMFSMVNTLISNRDLRDDMGIQARKAMEERTWERVFDTVYQGYGKALDIYQSQPHTIKEKFAHMIESMKRPERAGT